MRHLLYQNIHFLYLNCDFNDGILMNESCKKWTERNFSVKEMKKKKKYIFLKTLFCVYSEEYLKTFKEKD